MKTEAPVWKALADPTRRRILDLLRARPMTTGALASRFEMSRIGVMKHLGVLARAGLVLVRRRGRERWNHLNPVPIQQIYRRWIRPFEALPADGLLRLKAVAERPAGIEEETETMSESTSERPFRASDVQLEIRIDADRDRVFGALVDETAAWWPNGFYVGAAPRGVTIEPVVGGRVFEDWGDGQGAMWATVTAIRRGERLEWAGDMGPDFAGPARSLVSFRLRGDGDRTVVEFRDTTYGQLAEDAVKGIEHGWRELLEGCLKPWVEQGVQPERPDSVV